MIPKGTDVHKIHGRNLPQRVTVRSAMAPIIGLKDAPIIPPTKIITDADAGGILKTSV